MKRWIAALLCAVLLLSLAACDRAEPGTGPDGAVTPGTAMGPEGGLYPLAGLTDPAQVAAALERRGGYVLRAAVLYIGCGEGWKVTLDYLRQPLVVNLEAEGVDASGAFNLAAYDVVYLDESLLSSSALAEICAAVEDYAAAGGAVFAPNGFYAAFSPDFFGASSFQKVEGYPDALTLPQNLGDLADLQTVIADFHTMYGSFQDARRLRSLDYGWAMTPDTAVPLVQYGGETLYAVNRFGDGLVLFANPLLPNAYVQSAFTMLAQNEDQSVFASTAASCNQLLLSEWAAYVSKQIYGFALDRVFGYYGSPSISWELHYEEITGFEHGSMQIFSDLTEQYRQVPSFTLIRSSYWWFLKAESLTYLLNHGRAGQLDFEMDYNESAYSSGVHVDSGGEWLSLAWLKDGGSYFYDYPEQTQRLYPCAVDYDGDGLADFFCGSSDGGVYYYAGMGLTGLDGRLKVGAAQAVTADGAPLSVDGGYSAPQVMDVDGDGALDLIVGCPGGGVRWYQGSGSLDFTDRGELVHTDLPGQSLPAVGDVDGDGVTDLLVGSDCGAMVLYYGRKNGSATVFTHDRMESYARLCADAELGRWLSPTLADYDGDGNTDALVGTYDGYIAVLRGDGAGNFTFAGYIDAQEQNYQGNHHLKFGTYCTPALWDLDGDGALDLLAGSLEYGLAYPIDSPYFPQRERLQAQANYVKDHRYYMGVHFYTNGYASPQRETWELAAHEAAMAAYGLSTDRVGANQHTWRTSSLSGPQTMLSLWRAGLLWQSGFGSPGDDDPTPQTRAENVVAYPFFLMDGEARTILVQNNAVLPHWDKHWSDLSGKYQMPVCIYYHCDFVYRSDEEAVRFLGQVDDFRRTYGYNFNMEDQLMRGSAAAYNLSVTVEATENGFTIVPGHLAEDFPLYDADAQSAGGLVVDVSDTLRAFLSTDARVWKYTGGGMAVGLDGPVTVSLLSEAAREAPHLEQVNIPAHITAAESGAAIAFLGEGMLQAVVLGDADTSDAGWTVDRLVGADGTVRTRFTKYGEADTLHINYQ